MLFKKGDKVLIGGLIPVIVYSSFKFAHGSYYRLRMVATGRVMCGYYPEERLTRRVK